MGVQVAVPPPEWPTVPRASTRRAAHCGPLHVVGDQQQGVLAASTARVIAPNDRRRSSAAGSGSGGAMRGQLGQQLYEPPEPRR
jgi:hypothetical protein